MLVCVDLADGPRRACSSRVLRVLAHLCFRSVVVSSFGWARFRMVRVFRADSPRVPGGQSACSPRTFRYSRCVSGGSIAFFRQSAAQAGWSAARCGQSVIPCRTVRAVFADSPPRLAGQSTTAWQLCFLVRFLPSSFLLPRVLQGIVPKT
jgi:hypothetical protein